MGWQKSRSKKSACTSGLRKSKISIGIFSPRCRFFTFVIFGFNFEKLIPKQMSQPYSPDELARLRALVQDYEKKLTDAAELVARVRHEINNPLAALLGQAQLLLA